MLAILVVTSTGTSVAASPASRSAQSQLYQPTSNQTSPAATPTPVPNPCPTDIQFTDVSATDYSCFDVRVMVHNGWISGFTPAQCAGYADYPCYLPYSLVTRAQLSRIVFNAFHLPPYNPPTPDFTDVPTSNFAYIPIESLYHLGYVSGYSPAQCGRAYPCFGPNIKVLRGEMARIVSNVAGYTDDTTSRAPTFADVPTSSFAFSYVERLVMHATNAPFPPGDPNQPSPCTQPPPPASPQPCYFPGVQAPRIDATVHT